uniref:Sensor domain-containing protein n=1 Tax=Globisporangium ultimum (strain ATCC 200006 / CBS 805.95 / DAOM BR144) TaxID=431595 RepID=K3WD16_GLOUD
MSAFYSKQDDGTWNATETPYEKHPKTPPSVLKNIDDVGTTNHAHVVPLAIAVETNNANVRHAGYQQETTDRPSGCASWVCRTGKLILFHLLNFVLGTTAFVIIVTFIPLSVGLIPLCCLGLVTFQMLATMTVYLVKMDVALTNMIIDDGGEKLVVHPRVTSGLTDSDKRSALSKLTYSSLRTLGSMMYFATVKFAIGIASCVVAAAVVGIPVCAIVFAAVSSDDVQLVGFTYDDHPVAYVLSAVGIYLIGLLLLPFVALVSRKLTEFVCATKNEQGLAAPPVMAV